VGTAVNLAPRLFQIFCATLCLSFQHPRALNIVQYSADGDAGKVTFFQDNGPDA